MRPLLACLLLVLAALAVPGQAQQPGPTATVLWAHGAAPAEGETLWSNFDKEDAKATDTANGPGYNCGVPVPVVGQAVCDEVGDPGATDPPEEDVDHTFTLPMDPKLAADLRFSGTTIGVNLFFGASTGTGSGNAVVRLRSGETVVAESDPIPFSYDQGYEPATGTAQVKVMTVAAGSELVWEIHATGKATGFFLGIHDDNGKSNLKLPLATAPAPETLDGATAHVALSLATPTNATHVYRWTTDLAAQQMRVSARLAAGNASLRVVDGANATVHNATIGANATKDLRGAPGNWTITVVLQSFRGDVSVDIGPVPGGGATGSGTSSKSGTSSPTNATGNATGDGKKDTPGPWLPAVLGTLALVAALRRRRA